jgi:cobalt/nickel transport system permease protein
MGSMLRYLHLLKREFQTKKRAALSRNILLNPRQTRQVTANLIGSLLIRSYDRGERIHQAMLARGYSGLTMTSEPSPFSRSERLFLGCLVLSLFLGQGL